MVSGNAALRAGSQRLVLRVGVVAEWPSDDPCDDVNQVPSCAMLVVSLAMPATPGTSSFITGRVPLSRTLWRRTNTAPRQREWVAGVPERGVPECRSGVWVPPGPGGSRPGQFLAPETQHDIGGVGDALGMRHHDHAFAELMGGVL